MFAHRGSLTEAPENTIPSFQHAIEAGAKAIELDVQLTKDDQLVICHDQRIERVDPGHNGLIKDFTLNQLREIDLGVSFSKEYEGVSFAVLNEVLEICPTEVLLNIEIKNTPIVYKNIEDKLMACLQEHHRIENNIVSSLDHLALKRVQKLDPEMKIGMLFQDRILEPWKYAANSGLDVYSLHQRYTFVDEEFVRKSHESGYKVYPWTVDSEYDLKRLFDYGVDGAFTNNPEIFGTKQTE